MIADPSTLPHLLTVDEVADLLRTTPNAVRIMHSRGKLPGAFRRGTRLLIARDILLRWIRESCTSPTRRKAVTK